VSPPLVRHHADVDSFLAVAGDFLGAREAEHNLIFGIASTLREAPEQYSDAPFLATVQDGDAVVAAAIQTPPFRLVLSEIDDAAAISALAAGTLDRELPGVLGPVGVVERFVAARTAAGGPAAVHGMSERIFRLTTVRPPKPVAGTVRLATPEDRDLVRSWLDGFMHDAFGDADPAEVVSMTERWIAGRGRTLHLWVDGDPVSLCGIGGPTPNGIRIGPVYTPPGSRGRGYASALVAAVSQAALDGGRRFCFLFTDAANPTANHIYQAIGYEHVRDVAVYDFGRR
jgi:predicted GNAT family acetyltransferase